MSNVILRSLFVLLSAFCFASHAASSLERGFRQPPAETKPAVYWYWISDNISREGITRDLEAMARAGIGEAFIGNVDVNQNQRGAVKALTEPWWQMVEHAIREGARVGVRVGMFNCPGWSQSGGPWVKPEQSMRYVTMSETRVSGPGEFHAKLPAPKPQFQDIAVLAFPAPARDNDTIARLAPQVTARPELSNAAAMFDGKFDTEALLQKSQKPLVVGVAAVQPFTARSLVLHPSAKPFRVDVELQCADEHGNYRTVRKFDVDRTNPGAQVGPMVYGPVAIAFAPIQSKQYRLIFTNLSKEGGFAEIELSGAARLERFVEKQLGKMWQTPTPLWDAYLWPEQAGPDRADLAIRRNGVQNLTSRMAADGTLRWIVPPGDWIVLRVGMSPTGVTNAPASPEGTGLEIDKMNSRLVRYHFDAFMGTLLKRMPEAERKALHHVIADSYETGAQNWTDGLAADFEKRYGYDPLPWLPVLGGRIVDTADASDRFLWDLRRLVADRISYDYVGTLRTAASERGLRLWLENYGHWGYPGEFLQYGGQSSDVGGEFWVGKGLGSIELRAAASAAHIYGKPVVSAEAFTGGPQWRSTPWSLKARGDWATVQGINHFVLHVYIHQPYEDRVPGVNAWFGTEFNRFNTWFSEAREWFDYMRRTHFLLQQGKYVADVAYFIGEDAPKMTGTLQPKLPAGYSYDFINAEVIEKRLSVVDGRFVLPDGMSYRVLVLPEQTTMRPTLLAKLRELIRAGGVVVGTKPLRSPSLENYPSCDREVKTLADEIWQDCDGSRRTSAAFGKGCVFQGVDLDAVFTQLGVAADLAGADAEKLLWTHRKATEGDIYYLSNQTDETLAPQVSFRVDGRQPELWDAVTGRQRDLSSFRFEQGRTLVPLELAPRQSLFIVFRKHAAARPDAAANFSSLKQAGTLSGEWTVQFDPKRGGPAEVRFDKLVDWTERSEEGIKHYSGTAVYQTTFDLPPGAGSRRGLYLDLGVVNSMARVRLNGKDLGLVWCAPWRVDISSAARRGKNRLVIEVTNTWNNRLVGDSALPQSQRRTSTAVSRITPKTALMPGGLIGPVTLQSER